MPLSPGVVLATQEMFSTCLLKEEEGRKKGGGRRKGRRKREKRREERKQGKREELFRGWSNLPAVYCFLMNSRVSRGTVYSYFPVLMLSK